VTCAYFSTLRSRIYPSVRMFSTTTSPPANRVERFVPSAKSALVVGNDDYHTIDKLKSCVKDAQDMHAELTKLGFDAEILVNGSGATVKDALARLGAKRVPGDLCLFYYSGHGLEYSNRNYVLNCSHDAEKGSPKDALLLQGILWLMCYKAENGVTAIISDACRYSPTLRPPALTKEERKIITEISPKESEFIFEFATGPNEAAYAGDTGANSEFTSHLLPLLSQDLDFVSMFTLARKRMRAAGTQQQSWTHNCLTRSVYLSAPNIVTPSGATSTSELTQ